MDAYTSLMEFLNTPEKVATRKKTHLYCRECMEGCAPKNYVGSQAERRGRDYCEERGDPNCYGVYGQEDIEAGHEFLQNEGYTDLEIDDVKAWLNPSFWLRINVHLKGKDFEPYWYQDRCLRCTAEKKVLRMSRRSGKTEFLASYLLYKIFNPPFAFYQLLVICPAQAQAKEVYDKMMAFLESNPRLSSTLKITKTPYFEFIVLATQCRVRIFTAGSHSGNKALGVRGQGGNELIMDEMDYLEEDDISTITPILTDEGGGRFIGASTLKGTETLFYKYCHTTNIKEFYVPFKARPDWTPAKEQDARDTARTELAWDLEYNVVWAGKVDGVFQRSYVMAAFNARKFEYSAMTPTPGWQYFMGVDWNGNNNGTRIMIIGFNPQDGQLYSVHKAVVAYKDWTQTKAINRIIALNRTWKPIRVMLDNGFGQFQDEVLRGFGKGSGIELAQGLAPKTEESVADARLYDTVEVVDFGSTIVVPNLYTKRDEEYQAKNFLVENLQRILEQTSIRLAADEELKRQLLEYVVAKYSIRNYAVYKGGVSGDHDLDALMLACFGFAKSMHREFQESTPVVGVGVVKKALEALQREEEEHRHPATTKQDKTEMPQAPAIVLPAVDNGMYRRTLDKGTPSRVIGGSRSGLNIDRLFFNRRS